MQIIKTQKKTTNKMDPKAREDLLAKLRKEHEKMVKGKFEFIDAQGGFLEFTYRFFPDDLLVTYKFIHGEICEIPMGLVKHLNNTTKKVRTFGLNQTGELTERGLPSRFETQSRVRFTPVEMF